MGGRSPKGSGSRPSDRASKAVSPVPASIPNAITRTFKLFDSIPRDGSIVHVAYIIRFNPAAKRWEALYRNLETGKREWDFDDSIEETQPRWCRRMPTKTPIPNENWFAYPISVPYLVRPKTLRERLVEWLSQRLPKWCAIPEIHSYLLSASAMSAGTAETQSGSGRKPASAVPNGETPK